MFKEDDYLKVYVEQGRDVVWLADGLQPPHCAQISAARFLQRLPGRRVAARVLGLPQNAELLTGLCRLAEQGAIRLDIAGPLVCETQAEQTDPERALYRMRQCLLSPSLGGWHVATAGDTASYRLVARLQAGPAADDSDDLVQTHPAWRDLSFLGRVDVRACGEVLAHLIDPRWYIDPQHPDRLSRAASFMGVSRKTQLRLHNGAATSPRYSRYQAVLRVWKCDPRPSPADMERPGYFLWRHFREQAEEWRGDLRAAGSLLNYLLRTWLQRLTDLTPQPVRLFSPSAIFRPYEVAAYRQHVASYTPK